MAEPIIKIENLWYSYNHRPVLKDVTLEIKDDDFVALIGPNGGGKTTLLKLMLGLLQPVKGEIRIFGEPAQKAARRIGYLPQYVHINRSFPISVMDVVLMGCLGPHKAWSRYTATDRRRARERLEQMEMWEERNNRISELSGGQVQRVLIARALVTEPALLVLDEPTASIDSKGQSDLYNILQSLNEKIPIIVATHDMLALSRYIKSVACVNREVLYHAAAEVTGEMLEMAYACPVDLIAHGLPHRVFCHHGEA